MLTTLLSHEEASRNENSRKCRSSVQGASDNLVAHTERVNPPHSVKAGFCSEIVLWEQAPSSALPMKEGGLANPVLESLAQVLSGVGVLFSKRQQSKINTKRVWGELPSGDHDSSWRWGNGSEGPAKRLQMFHSLSSTRENTHLPRGLLRSTSSELFQTIFIQLWTD